MLVGQRVWDVVLRPRRSKHGQSFGTLHCVKRLFASSAKKVAHFGREDHSVFGSHAPASSRKLGQVI